MARANCWKKFLMIEKKYISESKLIGMHSYSCFILFDLLSAYLMIFFMLFLEKIAKLGQFWTEIKSFKNNFFKEFQVPLLPFHKKKFEKYIFFHSEWCPKKSGATFGQQFKNSMFINNFFFQKREPSWMIVFQ